MATDPDRFPKQNLTATHVGTSGATQRAESYDGKVLTIDLNVWIAASPEVVFDMSRSIDTHSASLPKSAERAVDDPIEGHIELGEQVTWRARHSDSDSKMTSRIAEMDRPRRFVDEQVAGTFQALATRPLIRG